MIFIFTAIYPEAKPLIQVLKLKKKAEESHYQQFVSEAQDLTLTITGVGPMNAAMVAASVLTAYGAGPEDQLLSLGTAAELSGEHRDERGCAVAMYHIHRITDKESGRSFYPDMLLYTGLSEASVVTGTELLQRPDVTINKSQRTQTDTLDVEEKAQEISTEASMPRMTEEILYDMEAAGVYQAASMFLGPHQMNFLRIVTDQGLTASELADPKALSEHVTECVASQVEKLLEIVDKLREISGGKEQSGPAARENVEPAVDRLILDAHFSRVMADECRQLLRYAELTQLDWRSAVEALYREERVPTRDKRAGKKILEELKRTLLCF